MSEKSIDDNNSYFVRAYVKRVQKVKIFIKGKMSVCKWRISIDIYALWVCLNFAFLVFLFVFIDKVI